MSWLVSSIANSLKLDDDDDDLHPKTTITTTSPGKDPPSSRAQITGNDDDQQIHSRLMDSSDNASSPSDQSTTTSRGVKEDLSEFSKTLTRQLWGVASFLAPPPPQISDRDRQSEDSDPNSTDPVGIAGIRNDLTEIGGKFRTGISKLSSNKAVTEFTKIASNFLQFGSEQDLSVEDYARRGVVGVTEEVVVFARDVALHPETWLDFPLPHDDDEEEDFDLSEAQQEHALAVESLAPELAALRMELCLGYMSEGSFWKIYFVLVHPRLSKNDAEILSTPEIVKARAMLTQELHSHAKSRPNNESGTGNASTDTTELTREEHLSVPVTDQSDSIPVEISTIEPEPEPASSLEADVKIDKHPITSTEIPVIDKTVVEEVPLKPKNIEKPTPSTSKSVDKKDDDDYDDGDDWLKEESTEPSAFKGNSYPLGNDDDVSFSDLEEDDDVATSSKKVGHGNPNSSAKESSDNSNDWLDVDDIDVA